MPTILLARHGQASFGQADYDVLSQEGHLQAAALADDLDRRGVRVDQIVSGSLKRQLDTAAPVAARSGVSVTVDARWNEYDANDVLAHHSQSLVRDSRPPGSDAPAATSAEFQEALEAALLLWIAAGPESSTQESWFAFSARARAALNDVGAGLDSGQTAIVFTSGGVLAAICVELLGVAPAGLLVFNRVSINASITKVVSGKRGSTLIAFNDHSHLDFQGGSLVTYR